MGPGEHEPPLTVTGAVLDGETRRAALRGRDDRGARARGRRRARRRDDRRGRGAAGRAAGQRPHARGDDPLPRLRRRPAADALAARRRSGRSRRSSRPRTSTGAPGSPARDDPHRHDPLLGHVLAPGGDRAGGAPTPACAPTIGAPLFDADGQTAGDAGAGAAPDLDRAGRARARDRRRARPALDLHGQRGAAALDRRAGGRARDRRSTSTSPRPSEEVDDCIAAHGVRPAAYLDRLGMLGERTVLAHGVWLDRDELELIAERGATVVTNPVANMKLARRRRLPLPGGAGGRGAPSGLGTDGAGSNDSLDLLVRPQGLRPRPKPRRRRRRPRRRRRGLADRHRRPGASAGRRPNAARTVVGAAGGLPAAGGRLGRARPRRPRLDLVYAASGSVVDTTVVAGRVLMRGGEVPGVEEIVARAAERARRLGIG